MENKQPATPAQAATPGKNEPGSITPAPAPLGGQGENQEQMVSIPQKQLRDLLRDQARYNSFNRDKDKFGKKNIPSQDFSGSDPDVVETLRNTQGENSNLRKELFQERLVNKTREFLNKDEFKNVPDFAKSLILKNPAAYTQAENVEDALFDIEDVIRQDILPSLSQSQKTPENDGRNNDSPQGHEAPPVPGSGRPAPAAPVGLEDTSRLVGPARSRATLRNAINKQKGKI